MAITAQELFRHACSLVQEDYNDPDELYVEQFPTSLRAALLEALDCENAIRASNCRELLNYADIQLWEADSEQIIPFDDRLLLTGVAKMIASGYLQDEGKHALSVVFRNDFVSVLEDLAPYYEVEVRSVFDE